jgi:hypothetical protein
MKNRRITIAYLIAVTAIATAATAVVSADDTVTLTAAPWKITYGKGWALVRVFDRDGNFGSPNRPDQTGHWKISGNMVVQTFADGRKDIFNLPLDPKNTTGIAKDGEAIKAAQDNTLPVRGADITLAQRDAAIPLLLAAPWKITGSDYFRIRMFARDGKFTTQGNGDEHGQWKLTGDMITLTFQDNHKDFLFLPLDPKASTGADNSGALVTAARIDTLAGNTAPQPGQPPGLTAPEPSGPMDEDAKNAIVNMLVSGPWKVSGNNGGWTNIHIFDKNGTFTTVGRAELHGHWKIVGYKLILNFVAGQKNTIQLPLDPKGSPGVADNGDPIILTPAAPK